MDDLKERMAGLRVEMPEQSASMHLAAIGVELREPGPMTVARHRTSVRRVGLAFAASLLLLLPTAVFASEHAVPGDLLYPIKIFVEQVQGVLDPDIDARNRIEEVEILMEREVDPEMIRERLQIAEDRLTDEDPVLQRRIESVRDRLDRMHPQGDVDWEQQRDREQGQSGATAPRTDSDPSPSRTDPSVPPAQSENREQRDDAGEGGSPEERRIGEQGSSAPSTTDPSGGSEGSERMP